MASIFYHRLTGSRSTQALSQKVQDIIKSYAFSIIPQPEPDPYKDLPLQDYRYNHRYPLFVHRDVRRITPSDEPQARLTSAIPVVTNLPGLTVSLPSPQALTGSGDGPEQNLFRDEDSPFLGIMRCKAAWHLATGDTPSMPALPCGLEIKDCSKHDREGASTPLP